jgi:2,5-diketo-D-gluconate reductase A
LKPEDPKNHLLTLETWNVLCEFKEKGKIRSIGVSNFLVSHLSLLIEKSKVVP